MVPLLEVRNLTLGYTSPLLKEISFQARAGEVIGILGRNGCGKTTLLRGLSGGIRRFSGEIFLHGRDSREMTLRQLAACISLLPQQTEIMEGISARQIVEMGRYPYGSLFGGVSPETDIRESAAQLGITQLLDADCARLSQGQRQLVLLCRLLVQDTPVMLLDEPNTALDYDNTFAVFRILREVVTQKKKAALMVLHDPELALAYCHRLLIVKDGKLCRDLTVSRAQVGDLEEALGQIYTNVILRQDPFDGRLRCYYQEREERRC